MNTIQTLLDRVANEGGSIVSSGSLSQLALVNAQACNRFYVDESGLGFVYIPPSNTIMGIPRRNILEQNNPAEMAIRNAVSEVEKMEANPALTDVVVTLNEAFNKLADIVDAKLI